MTEEKNIRKYEKPEVEVIELDKDVSFMTKSTQIIGPIGGESGTEIDIS